MELLCAAALHLMIASEPGSVADLIGTYEVFGETLQTDGSTCERCDAGLPKHTICLRQHEKRLVTTCTTGDLGIPTRQTGRGFASESGCKEGAATLWEFNRTADDGRYAGIRRTELGASCIDGKVAQSCTCAYAFMAFKISDAIGSQQAFPSRP